MSETVSLGGGRIDVITALRFQFCKVAEDQLHVLSINISQLSGSSFLDFNCSACLRALVEEAGTLSNTP